MPGRHDGIGCTAAVERHDILSICQLQIVCLRPVLYVVEFQQLVGCWDDDVNIISILTQQSAWFPGVAGRKPQR